MTNTKMRRPVVLLVVVGAATTAVIAACSDDGSSGPSITPEAGTTPEKPDTSAPPPDGATGDAGDAATEEHTVSIGVGFATGCALSNKGRVKCWGDAADGEFLTAPIQGKKCIQYADLSTIDCDPRTATDLPINYPVIELSVGYLTVCAIVDDGGTKRLGCWGTNARGGLTSAADGGAISSVVWINLPSPPKHIVEGRNFKVVLLEDKSVWAWGDNRYGQYGGATLGENGKPERIFPFAGDAGDAGDAGPTVVLEMAASYLDTFLLTNDGLYGVGDNSSAQLMIDPGVAGEVHAFTKLPVPADGGVVGKLFRSGGYAVGQCYTSTTGNAYCWGDNNHGQVGATAFSLTDPVITPQRVDLPANRKVVGGVAEGSGQACAILDDATVWCWGENDRGESGQTKAGDVYTPVQVQGIANATSVAAGREAFTCALTADHKIYCWGDNNYGNLGTLPPDGGAMSATPVEVPLRW
jgi:alpha-tubulin suppressor-like RCC1 family protein